jgi:hypothetical protein
MDKAHKSSNSKYSASCLHCACTQRHVTKTRRCGARYGHCSPYAPPLSSFYIMSYVVVWPAPHWTLTKQLVLSRSVEPSTPVKTAVTCGQQWGMGRSIVVRQPVCWSAGGSVLARCTGCVGRPVDSCFVGSAIWTPAHFSGSLGKDRSIMAGCVWARSSVAPAGSAASSPLDVLVEFRLANRLV